jgi:farnesyl-diphosphate farnesyltransferase
MQVRMLLETRRVQRLVQGSQDLQFCYSMLNKVSRSFSVVIQQLPDELRDAVCVFYLILRALDTVEDDMAVPVERKVPLLKAFHERISDLCVPQPVRLALG